MEGLYIDQDSTQRMTSRIIDSVCLMNADEAQTVCLTDNPGSDWQPRWGRRQ